VAPPANENEDYVVDLKDALHSFVKIRKKRRKPRRNRPVNAMLVGTKAKGKGKW